MNDSTTLPDAPCLELEQLAALAEGRLTGRERHAALAHVADCPTCRELFVEIRRSLDDATNEVSGRSRDQGPEEGQRMPAAGSRRPESWRLFAFAATLVALVASGILLYLQPGGGRALERGALVALLPPPSETASLLWGGVVERGSSAGSPLARDSAELGALLLDLDIALTAGDPARIANVARRLATIVESAGLLEADARRLRELAEIPQAFSVAEVRRTELAALEARLHQRFLPFYLDLGAFAEAARLAAKSSAPELLDDSASRGYVRWLLKQEGEPLADAQREALATLASDRPSHDHLAAAELLLDSLTR